jgi:hypothetical protein
VSASNAGSTAPLSATSGTLAQADSLVFGLVGWTTGTSTVSAGSGYSNLITSGGTVASNRFGALESKVVAATTAQTADFTLGTSRPWGCVVAAYRASAAAGSATPQPFTGQPPTAVHRSFSW